MNYTTELGPKLTEWAINKIKRDYPDDVALLVGLAHCSPDGSGHGECFDYFVPATEKGYELEQEIYIDGVNHDLYPRDWARCERTANLEDWCTFCLANGEILYARSQEDVDRFEALRQQLKENLANPAFVYPKALERLDEAMNLYRNMMFEDRLHQVRMAAGYIFNGLLKAVLWLNGTYYSYHLTVETHQLARCKRQPEHFAAYYQAMLSAKNTSELKSIAHLMIQTTRKFIAGYKPEEKEEASKNYKWLAMWYSEMSLTWRRLRHFCEAGCADAAFTDACTLQEECNVVTEEFGLPDFDLLSGFDCDALVKLSKQATEVEEQIKAYVIETHGLIPQYAAFEDFLKENP